MSSKLIIRIYWMNFSDIRPKQIGYAKPVPSTQFPPLLTGGKCYIAKASAGKPSTFNSTYIYLLVEWLWYINDINK